MFHATFLLKLKVNIEYTNFLIALLSVNGYY